MPGIPGFTSPAGPYARVSDPSVAFDARHNVWMVSSLALNSTPSGVAVIVNRSTNGGTSWGNPVTVHAAGAGEDLDKNWTVCDNTSTSPFYGSCYTQWDDHGGGNLLKMAYSRDGGLTWTLSKTPRVGVIGGPSFGQAFTITSISSATDPGGIRSGPLPSAEIDGSGKIFVAWADCRFRTNCTQNDIVYTTSTNGSSWTAVQRVPIDSVTSGVDHLLPGLGVDKATSGASAHLGLLYYFFPAGTTNLSVGYISSTNGGSTWSAPTQLAGPMTMSWLPNTSQGRMVGDYMSTSFAGGTGPPVFTLANAPTAGGSDCQTATPNCDQALYTPSSGLAAAAGSATASDPVVFSAKTNNGAGSFHSHQ